MKTILLTLSLAVFLLIGSLAILKGLDLRKRLSWIYGVISFFCGFVLGFSLSSNIAESIKAGVLFAFLTLLSGAAMRRHKLRYKGMAKSLLLEHGKEDDPSIFARLVRSLLGRYK